jgi:hypothetical protein
LTSEFEGEGLEPFPDAFRLREASGSFMKTHSRPRATHLPHGCWRLHLTFDSAQDCQKIASSQHSAVHELVRVDGEAKRGEPIAGVGKGRT